MIFRCRDCSWIWRHSLC